MKQALKKIQFMKFYIIGIILMMSLSSCIIGNSSNNYLHIEDLVDHMVAEGIKVTQVQPLEPRLIGASRGFAVTIDGKEIGIYKYDINIKKQQEKLANIKETGRVYVLAIKYPTVVKGSFMLIGVGQNPKRDSILAALDSFK